MAENTTAEAAPNAASDRAMANVTDAIRLATEASLAPVTKPQKAAAATRSLPARAPAPPGPVASPPTEILGQEGPGPGTPGPELPDSEAVAAPAPFGAMAELPPTLAFPAVAAETAGAVAHVPTPATLTRKMEIVMTTAEELMSFQQGNFEALVKSGQIWAAGLQDLGRSWAASAQAQMDETMGTVKAMTGVKSLREAVELQSTLARSSMEKVVSEGGKLTETSMKLAEQTMAPITARLTLAAERFGRSA